MQDQILFVYVTIDTNLIIVYAIARFCSLICYSLFFFASKCRLATCRGENRSGSVGSYPSHILTHIL